jgi:hypothetical protein
MGNRMTQEMKSVIDELNTVVTTVAAKLSFMPETDFDAKPDPRKWSKKEVLGHLIDSAHNNLRRFVVGQYESTPPHIIYEQEAWVAANDYQHELGENLVTLWRLINHRIAAVLSNLPIEAYSHLCNTGKGEVSLRALDWLAADYIKHMKHHVNQILPGSYPVTYP